MVTRILIILLALTLSASAQRICPPNQVNRNGLVGRWLVPGKQTGTVATPTLCLDDSGKGNHGTVVSNANYGIIFSRPAMTFDGSSQYVIVGSPSVLNFGVINFSISAWVKTASGASFIVVVAKANQTLTQYYLVVANGKVAAQEGNGFQGIGSVTVSDGNWHHIVAVFPTIGTLNIYTDAKQEIVSGGDIYGANLISNDVMIGARRNNSNSDAFRFFNGSINDVRVYRRALSAAEIRAIYQGQQ